MKTNTTKHEALMDELMEKSIQEKTRDAFEKVLKTQAGRWFFIQILDMTGYQAETFTGNAQTYYNEGRRSIGLNLKHKTMALLGKEGFQLVQKAEKEFVDFQYAKKKLFEEEEQDNANRPE